MALLIVLVIAAGVLLLPQSLTVRWENLNFTVFAGAGPVSFQVYSGKRKKERQPKQEKPPEEKPPKEKTLTAARVRYLAETVPELVRRLLGRIRRRLRIDPLEIGTVFRGEDPADVAVTYGRFQALASALLPFLEETVKVGRVTVSLAPDFTEGTTESRGTVGLRFRMGPLLGMGISSLADLIRWYRGWKALAPAAPQETKNKQATEA